MSLSVFVMPDQPVAMSFRCSPDGSLSERARDGLTASPYPAVRRIEVEERQGVLTLSGRLPNFYLKQIAQASVAKVAGVRSIVNRIDVVEPDSI
jgi:osmotically-inducible protein OsmY